MLHLPETPGASLFHSCALPELADLVYQICNFVNPRTATRCQPTDPREYNNSKARSCIDFTHAGPIPPSWTIAMSNTRWLGWLTRKARPVRQQPPLCLAQLECLEERLAPAISFQLL